MQTVSSICKSHGHQPVTRMHHRPTYFSRLLQQLCPPPHKHFYQNMPMQHTLKHKHNQTFLYLPPAVMNDIWR